ncbi:hypothetical protein GQ53DRAFT_762237 [Thozetella sp. PMI_491]|nr:hypothetical protein GQ53DRAFT_762237 [Thozetella sp. PMI_491]
MPGKPSLVAPTSTAELHAVRRRCARSLLALLPKGVGSLYFGGGRGGALWLPWSTSPVAPASPERAGGRQQDELTGSSDLGPERSGPRNGHSQTPGPGLSEIVGSKRSSGRDSDSGDTGGQRQGSTAGGQPASAKPGDRPVVGREAGQPPEDSREARILSGIESGILDVFGDAYCNKHLMYSVLELVLVRLIPELAERGVTDLWEERLS